MGQQKGQILRFLAAMRGKNCVTWARNERNCRCRERKISYDKVTDLKIKIGVTGYEGKEQSLSGHSSQRFNFCQRCCSFFQGCHPYKDHPFLSHVIKDAEWTNESCNVCGAVNDSDDIIQKIVRCTTSSTFVSLSLTSQT